MSQARVTTQFSTCILFSILILFLLPNLVTAAIIPNGDIVPSYPVGAPDPWDLNYDDLIVGDISDGSLYITNASEVANGNGFVGHYPGFSGIVTVTGTNTFWFNRSDLYIGYDGEGEMLISDGAYVENDSIGYVAYNPNSRGRVTVTGTDSRYRSWSDLYIGYDGEGKMSIRNGGYVRSSYVGIGYGPASRGIVTVTGQDSLLQSSEIGVGFGGEGEMLISDGGQALSEAGWIGGEPGSSGVVTVTGQGSLWLNFADIYVGGSEIDPGGTGLLNITNGGIVEAGAVLIWPSGTLTGDGTVVASVINTGAIKPGNSIGTLTIDGDLTMESGSIYEVEVDNSGNSDLLSVTDDVDIVGGTVQPVSTEAITGSQQYTIIEANDVSGTFDTIDTSLFRTGLFPDVSLNYEPDSVLLQIDATRFDDPSILQTDNQRSLGRALQQIADGGGNSITTALQGLETNDQVRGAYDQLSGQTRPQLASVTAAGASRFMGTVSDRLNYANEDLSYYGFGSGPLLAMAEADKTGGDASMFDTYPFFDLGNGTTNFGDQKWGFWGRGYGVFGDRDTAGGVAGYDYTVYGTTLGLDYQITEYSLLGITAGYSYSDVDSSLAGSDSDISNTHIGIYGNKNTDNWHFDAIFTYSFLEYETERTVRLVGERLEGDFDGQGISGYLEARYDWRDLNSWLLQPLVSFQLSYLDLDSYTESGGTSSLGYDDQSYSSYKGSLGIKVTKELFKRDDDRSAHIQLRGRWVHEFGDDNSSVDAHFASDPGVVFKVSDEDVARDSAVLGAGFHADLSRRTRLLLGYDAQLNNDDNMHFLSAMVVHRW